MREFYNEDCMEGMKKYPDKYFDLAIVDPPYGLGIDGQKEQLNNKNPKHNRKGHDKKDWDDSTPDLEYFVELERVSKDQIIWGANYFLHALNQCTKGWIVWYKGQEGLTMSDAELAFSSFDVPTRVVKINRVELLKDGTIHPTQKPLKLYKWLLQNYAKPGDKILDTHVGSASSLIAFEEMGFDYVGFEIDLEYYQNAVKRINTYRSQLKLF
jgi:site-specific DNA-methyltransferase (adenine-specific)